MKRSSKQQKPSTVKQDPAGLIKKVFFVSVIFLAALLLFQWVTEPKTSSKPIDGIGVPVGGVELDSNRSNQ